MNASVSNEGLESVVNTASTVDNERISEHNRDLFFKVTDFAARILYNHSNSVDVYRDLEMSASITRHKFSKIKDIPEYNYVIRTILEREAFKKEQLKPHEALHVAFSIINSALSVKAKIYRHGISVLDYAGFLVDNVSREDFLSLLRRYNFSKRLSVDVDFSSNLSLVDRNRDFYVQLAQCVQLDTDFSHLIDLTDFSYFEFPRKQRTVENVKVLKFLEEEISASEMFADASNC